MLLYNNYGGNACQRSSETTSKEKAYCENKNRIFYAPNPAYQLLNWDVHLMHLHIEASK
jgi:hypothetical protein